MINNLQEKKEEAVKRMKLLGIAPNDIQNFIKSEYNIAISMPGDFNYSGIDNLLSGSDNDMALFLNIMIGKFNEKFPEHLLYYVILNDENVTGYRSISFLFVEKYVDDWAFVDGNIAADRRLQNGIPYKYLPAYVYNLDIPDYSETGFVQVINNDGILYRIG